MKTFLVVNIFLIIANCLFFINSNFFGNLLKLVDQPDNNRKIHKISIPILGGTLLIINLLINFALLLILNIININIFIGYSLILISFFILGTIDDYKNIKPKIKLLTSIMLYLIFLIFFKIYIIDQLTFSSFNKIISLGIFSIPFTILCFLLLQNAINMTDGIDGLLSIVSIAILIFCFLYNNFNNKFITFYILSLIIFLIIYLIFNLKKKTFMGDSGTFIIALSISLIIINIYLNNNLSIFNTSFKIEQIFLLLLLPGIDMFRVFILRISLGKNPLFPDNNHLHHYLLNYIKSPMICLVYFIMIIISNLLANFYPEKTLLITISTILFYLLLLFSSFKKLNVN